MDFAEFFTDHARAVVTLAWRKGLSFVFDYRGPFLDIEADPVAMSGALSRLSHSALELLDDGFIFITAQADWNQAGLADIAVSIGGTGSRAPMECITGMLGRLQLTERSHDAAAREGARVADGFCPLTGAKLSFASNRSDGILFAYDATVPATLLDSDPAPSARGARAWLIEDRPGIQQSLARRLQRFGWATTIFASVEQATSHLATLRGGMPRPALVIVAATARPGAAVLHALREAMPPSAQLIVALAGGAGVAAAGATGSPRGPATGSIEMRGWPLSPGELMESTRRLHRGNQAASSETMPAPLLVSPRPQALVVDDNSVNLLVAGGLLQVAGFEVHTAASGEEAIERCRALPPDIVLMDVHMPGMNGLEATRALRRLQREGALPHFVIVAATADALDIGEPVCREAGMDGYLSKPLTLPAIEGEVERLLPGLRRSLGAP